MRRLDRASGSEDDDRYRDRLHRRKRLDGITLERADVARMAGVGTDRRASPARHVGHRVRGRMVGPEEAERGAAHDRLGHQEGEQGREGEAAGTDSLAHRGGR